MWKSNKQDWLLVFLVVLVAFLIFLNIELRGSFSLERPQNIAYDEASKTLDYSTLTLEQKIGQMVIALGKEENKEVFQNMLIGGFHLKAKESREDFIEAISDFQEESIIPFFVTIDLEGCNNPLENVQKFPASPEIKTEAEAYWVGYEQGKLLKDLGFSINFAPVVDLEDKIWKCRSFSGTPEEIADKSAAYVIGLQDNGIIATSKHYPGKTLSSNDPHFDLAEAYVGEEDLLPFERTIRKNVSAVMISHLIIGGSLDSEGKPASVSSITSSLREGFGGLIITDEIGMQGLTTYYPDSKSLFLDLFEADNDLIIYFDSNPKHIHDMILTIEEAVKQGKITEARIDRSVKRILKAKGIRLI